MPIKFDLCAESAAPAPIGVAMHHELVIAGKHLALVGPGDVLHGGNILFGIDDVNVEVATGAARNLL